MSRAMKKSGVPWIGDLPNEWQISKLKRCVAIRKRIAGETGRTVLSITQKGIVPKDLTSNEGQIAADYSNYQIVHPGDFAMNHMDLLTGWVDISRFEGVTSPDYRVFELVDKSRWSQRYLLHLLQTCYRSHIFYGLGQGVSGFGRWRLPADMFLHFDIPCPEISEQQRIADFLDIQTQEVDAAIVKTRESIEEYKKLKQAIITHAVTKGIRPNRAVKDSGVEQIRAMPEQWEVFRLKNAFSAHKSGAWGNDKNPHETGVVCYRIADFAYDKLRFNDETSRTIRYYQSREIEKLRLTKGDILIEKSGGGEKTPVGRAVLYDKDDGIALYANFMEKLTVADKVNPDWAVYYLSFLYSSKRVIPHIKQTTGLQNLDLRSFLSEEKMLLPPDCEQEEIVHYLDNKCGAIDALIEKKQQIITELESYKKSLIYEYVTGKKEVPA